MSDERWFDAYDEDGNPLPPRPRPAELAERARMLLRDAFADVAFPGRWNIARASAITDEPRRVAEVFADKADWRACDPAFLDGAPDGQGSALSFFTDPAWRFYLPAYLIADLDGALVQAQPLYNLVGGLADQQRDRRIDPRFYGERTWGDEARHRLAMLTSAQIAGLVAYLEVKALGSDHDAQLVAEARAAWFDARLAGAD